MSSSFGGGSSGDIRYTISVDDSQAIQKLQGVSQQMQQLGQTGGQASKQLQQMPRTLDEVATESDKVAQSTDKTSQSFQQQGQAVQQAGQQQQSFGQVLKNNITNIVQIGTGILGLVTHYTSLQRAQIQINRLQVNEANQRRLLGVLTRQHADAVAKYGANSQEALDIENKINVLQGRHAVTLDQIDIRQQQLNESTIGFGLSLIQTGTGIAQAVTGLKTYRGAADAAKVATTGLATSMNKLKIATVIGAILVGIEVASQAIANNWGGVQQRLDEFYNWLVKVAPVFKPVIDAIWTIGKAVTALFTGDIDALTKMFSKSAAAAPAAVTGIDDVSTALDGTGKEAAQAQKEIDDLWSKLKEGANIKSALKIDINKDKLTRKLLDYLPDSVSKNLKIYFKTKDSVATIKQSFEETIAAASELNYSDAKVDKIVKGTMKYLKEKFPKDPGAQKMREELGKTIAGDDTLSQVQTLIQGWEIDPTTGITLGNQIGTNVGKGIADTMTDLDWQKIMAMPYNQPDQYVQSGVNSQGKPIFKHKKDEQDKNGITKLVENMANSIKNYDWSSVGKAVSQGLLNGLQTLTNWGTTAVTWIVQQIKNVNVDQVYEVGKQIGIAIGQGIQTLTTWGAEAVGWLVQQIKNVKIDDILNVGNLIASAILSGVKTFVDFGKGVIDFIVNNIDPELAKTPERILKLGRRFLQGIFDGFASTNTGKIIIGGINNIVSSIDKILSNPTDTIFKLGRRLLDGIIQGFDTIKNWGTRAVSWISDQITGAISNIVEIGKEIGQGIWDGIVAFFTGKSSSDWKDAITGNILPPKIPTNPQGGTKTTPSAFTETPMDPAQGLLNLPPEDLQRIIRIFQSRYGMTEFSDSDPSRFHIPPNRGQPNYRGKTPLSDSISGGRPGDLIQTSYGTFGQNEIGQIVKANPLDIMARQLVQITKDLSIFAKAVVTTTKDISVYAKSIVETIKDHNTFAKTIVTVYKDISVLAKSIVTTYKDISVLAKAIVTTTKDNNQFARTIVQVTKDLNQSARAIVTNTKDLNQMARALVQTEKDARALAKAIRSIPKAPSGNGGLNFGSAQHGMHTNLSQDTLILAHAGERVDIGGGGSRSSSSTSVVHQTINLSISGNDIINERNLSKRIRTDIGQYRDRLN